VDMQKQLLDELMGRNRNGDDALGNMHYSDPKVCRSFLCGLCPRELFTNTKVDTGGCPKLHEPTLLRAYEDDKKKKSNFVGFEREWEQDLMKYIDDCDNQIRRSQSRVKDDDDKKQSLSVENDELVIEITEDIKKLVAEAEALGEEGKVDESQEIMKKVEELRTKKVDAQAQAARKIMPHDPAAAAQGTTLPNQKLRVCDVCGAFLSITDSDRRLADHFGGKMHIGYARIRETVEQLRQSRESKKRARSQSPRRDDRDKGRDRRDRDRDRDKESDRDRERDRDRDRDNRDRDRGRDYRDRDRDRDQHRGHRDRDRDRGSRYDRSYR